MDTPGRARTKSREKARKAQPKGPRVTNGPPEGARATPTVQIDLTGDPPRTGATPPTQTQGEGQADPKGQGKAQEEGEQLAYDQEDSLKVG